MKTLSTIGYRMLNDNKKRYSEDIFRECLINAGVDLLLDIRYYHNGQFWNPLNIKSILRDSGIKYSDQYHIPLGIKNGHFTKSTYIEQLKINKLVFIDLRELINTHSKVAIMCCEPLIKWKVNCHRFILAAVLKKLGLINKIEHLCMDATYDRMIN